MSLHCRISNFSTNRSANFALVAAAALVGLATSGCGVSSESDLGTTGDEQVAAGETPFDDVTFKFIAKLSIEQATFNGADPASCLVSVSASRADVQVTLDKSFWGVAPAVGANSFSGELAAEARVKDVDLTLDVSCQGNAIVKTPVRLGLQAGDGIHQGEGGASVGLMLARRQPVAIVKTNCKGDPGEKPFFVRMGYLPTLMASEGDWSFSVRAGLSSGSETAEFEYTLGLLDVEREHVKLCVTPDASGQVSLAYALKEEDLFADDNYGEVTSTLARGQREERTLTKIDSDRTMQVFVEVE